MSSTLPYNPQDLRRELKPFYISASSDEQKAMMERLGKKQFKDLYTSLPEEIRFKGPLNLPKPLSYENLVKAMEDLAKKNTIRPSFIGDALPDFQVPEIVPFVCSIRGLTTAYTPYQPERSQGTLNTLWIYSSAMAALTGFEAINASLYERSTCLSEALNTATRLKKNKMAVLVSETLFPGDLEVIHTLAIETELKIIPVPVDQTSGLIDQKKLAELFNKHSEEIAGFAFPQVTNLGLLEEVNALTDFARQNNILSIAVIDPFLIGHKGLKEPARFGSDQSGVDMIVGEGQHLSLAPNFGGPGLGIFGIRYNEKDTLSIRSTAGRYVGLGIDQAGRRALSMVLSTREQHIRREKATSNICSNQSFVASITGAALLQRGDEGMAQSLEKARTHAVRLAKALTQFKGVELAYPNTPFYNEITLKITGLTAAELIQKAREHNLHLGVDVSARVNGTGQLIKISFNDRQTDKDLASLENFFEKVFKTKIESAMVELQAYTLEEQYKRQTKPGIATIPLKELKEFYTKLGLLNLSPDDNIYPLGSCTMKYNPYVNDYAASLEGFTNLHPQAPVEDAQGSLEVLYETQEWFKTITGLDAVTTQPVAGAQGELVGLKMFQAYHRNKGEADTRNLLLIPRSAHGTNPATATMAGFDTKKLNGVDYGIITINANAHGQIDLEQVRTIVAKEGKRIAGIMITNPNTSGLFESDFKEIAELIHSVDGLVYMDGANMNAVAGWADLGAMGVDAVHNNLHKTWTIPHGGGGPGDAIVAVSAKLVDYLPGHQVIKSNGQFQFVKAPKSIGSFHRHHGNFAHKVRCYTYLRALGSEGITTMSAVSVLAANYLYAELKDLYPSLPEGADQVERMHEFILTLSKDLFDRIQKAGTPKAQAIAKIGKIFLDFGMHAPTVAFPEVYGMMIEPTESFSKSELDRFVAVVRSIHHLISEHPEVLTTAPHFTPVKKVDEVYANKNLILSEPLTKLPEIGSNPIDPKALNELDVGEVCRRILEAHRAEARSIH